MAVMKSHCFIVLAVARSGSGGDDGGGGGGCGGGSCSTRSGRWSGNGLRNE